MDWITRDDILFPQQIDDALTQFSQHKKLTQTDSVFVTIMSHGDMGIISGTDSKAFKTEEIFQHLNAKNCPALVNKPKIIIIQACRGGNSHLSSHTQYNTYIYLLSSITADMDADPLKMKRSTFHLSQVCVPCFSWERIGGFTSPTACAHR